MNNSITSKIRKYLFRDKVILTLALLLFLLIVFSLSSLFYNIFISSCKQDLLHNFYLFAGVLSGVFSALAFVGVLYTINIQIKELKQQKRDNEIKQFDDVFYTMLEMQQNIVSNLSIDLKFRNEILGFNYNKTKRVEGRDLFKCMFNEANITVNSIEYKGIEDLLIKTKNIQFYGEINDIYLFDHYFRHLYRIYKFLTNSKHEFLNEMSEDNLTDKRYEYSTIIRSTLSAYELIFLFINCLFMDSIKEHNFKKYAEKYAFFDNLRDGNFQDIYDEFSKEYDDSALYSPKALLKTE